MFSLISDVQGGPHERRLLNDLLEHYNTLERPVYNESEPLELLFGLTLQQIIDVVSENPSFWDIFLSSLRETILCSNLVTKNPIWACQTDFRFYEILVLSKYSYFAKIFITDWTIST